MTDASAAGSVEPRVSDETTELARRYAEALIGAAEKEGGALSLLDELAEIEKDVLKAFPRFADLLASARVSTAHKDEVLTKVFANRASDLVLRFLRVLNRHERLGNAGGCGTRGAGDLGPSQQAHPGARSRGRLARRKSVANTP